MTSVSKMPPETRYALKGETSIAYQVVGDGPLDLIFVSGVVSQMALFWSDPHLHGFCRRLSSFTRLILFDKPGTGLSDPVSGAPSLEQRMEDVRVVLDAVGSKRAAILGYSEGGTAAAMFAATYPERCAGLVLIESGAKWLSAPDYLPEQEDVLQHCWDLMLERTDDWGSGRVFQLWGPSVKSAPGMRQAFGSAERLCASPGMAKAVMRASLDIDARSIMPRISSPTLVLHCAESFIPASLAEYVGAHIPGAKVRIIPGYDHMFWYGDWEAFADEIEEFLTGARHAAESDRALATVLFTDIVGSTERAADIGDERWLALVERHDEIARVAIAHYGGRAIKTLGDGILACFEGPAKAIRCASSICSETESLGLAVRAGVHTGECERRGDDLAGIAVNIGARIGALAGPSEVLVSGTVRELVLGSGLTFEERGEHVLKGVPGEWRLYAVTGDGRTDARPVSEVDAATAARTPSAAATLRPRDRAMGVASRRAPGMLRVMARASLAMRRVRVPDRG